MPITKNIDIPSIDVRFGHHFFIFSLSRHIPINLKPYRQPYSPGRRKDHMTITARLLSPIKLYTYDIHILS